MPKTLFLTVYDGDTEKVILRSGIFERLKQSGHRIVLLIRGASRLDYYKENFEDAQVSVELLPPALTRGEEFWHHISWNTVPTHSVYLRRHINFYKKKSVPRFVFEWACWTLAHSRRWRQFLRSVYLRAPDDYAQELFEKYKPDLLFAPNMFSPEDCRMLRAAKRRGVKTITTAKSWDVLTTKAFTRVIADKLLVFNEFNKEEAIELGEYTPEAVEITGFPQFDGYARSDAIMPRSDFVRMVGADPAKRLILMGIPGDWMTPYTHEILSELDRRIEAGEFVKPLLILARLHPKYPDTSEKMTYKHIIFDRPGTLLSPKKEFSIDMSVKNTYAFTFTDKDIAHLANSIRHSDVVINTGSTLTLDAAANDRPSILVGYDGDHHPAYWDSIARIYERNHFRHVLDTGAAPLVKSHDELAAAISHFLEDSEYLREEREALKKHMLYRVDGKSAERTANAVLGMLQK